MRAVIDTNEAVSGLLWRGPSRRVLDAARADRVELFTTLELLAELEEALYREKFLKRLQLAQLPPVDLITGYAALATVVRAAAIPSVIILRDPDDDALIASAISARADVIVSGDRDLLDLRQYKQIEIITAVDFLNRLS
jgi:putative PIN family toxin of toxin-antitoxin system